MVSFCEDVAASGGYWLACAGDQIFANPNSILGSIGVISAGFGFPELIERFGIERRVYATNSRKGMLDPFQDEKPKISTVCVDFRKIFLKTLKLMSVNAAETVLERMRPLCFAGMFGQVIKRLR